MKVFMTRNAAIQHINLTKLWGMLTTLSRMGLMTLLPFILDSRKRDEVKLSTA